MLILLLALSALADEPVLDDDDPDAYDDPTVRCAAWENGDRPGGRVGRQVFANDAVARSGLRILARRVDAETVQSRKGDIVATWTTDEYGDPFAILTWTPHGIYRSYRFWDDGIFAFELPNGGAQLGYDMMGCDRHELLLAAIGVISRRGAKPKRATEEESW